MCGPAATRTGTTAARRSASVTIDSLRGAGRSHAGEVAPKSSSRSPCDERAPPPPAGMSSHEDDGRSLAVITACYRRFMRRLAVLAAVLLSHVTTAHAGRSHFGWLYGSDIIPERGVEVESWIVEENQKGDAHTGE